MGIKLGNPNIGKFSHLFLHYYLQRNGFQTDRDIQYEVKGHKARPSGTQGEGRQMSVRGSRPPVPCMSPSDGVVLQGLDLVCKYYLKQ